MNSIIERNRKMSGDETPEVEHANYDDNQLSDAATSSSYTVIEMTVPLPEAESGTSGDTYTCVVSPLSSIFSLSNCFFSFLLFCVHSPIGRPAAIEDLSNIWRSQNLPGRQDFK